MLAVALVVVAGWLVVSVKKVDDLEQALEQARRQLQNINQSMATSESQLVDDFDRVKSGLSAMDERIGLIEKRLNIGDRVTGSTGVLEKPPPTRRIIQEDGSLVIKTPLVE
jgi:hypothetical protein